MHRPDGKWSLQDWGEGLITPLGYVSRLRRCDFVVTLSHSGRMKKQPRVLVDRERRTRLVQDTQGYNTDVSELHDQLIEIGVKARISQLLLSEEGRGKRQMNAYSNVRGQMRQVVLQSSEPAKLALNSKKRRDIYWDTNLIAWKVVKGV